MAKKPESRFYFWFRFAQYLYKRGGRISRAWAKNLYWGIIHRWGVDIGLDAVIGPGLSIGHFGGIVVTGHCIIGERFSILQNTTIGLKHPTGPLYHQSQPITIGNDVCVGAHSCIIGDGLSIGNRVTIGAMSFVNKDIPDDAIFYTEKTSRMDIKTLPSSA
jgi:serine acetyltransferase